MAEERVFLAESGVQVTNARFVYGGQTYAMANITSVRAAPDGIGKALVLLILGVVLVGAHQWWAAVLVVIAALAIWYRKTWVVLHTSGMEQRALASRDGQFIARVMTAVNEAIVHRG